MKLAIIGSRDFTDYALLKETLAKVKSPIELIVSGGAKGADTLGENYAIEHGIPTKIHIPQWYPDGKYDKSAGFKRNRLIINDADCVIAFWDGQSKGTKSSIDLAQSQGKIVHTVYFEPKEVKAFTPVENPHYQYFRTDEEGKRFLQCHSKGAKEYSPFNCLVEAFGVTKSIEDHYQCLKVFQGPEGQIAQARDWRDAKEMQRLGIERVAFRLPNGVDLGNYNSEATDLPVQYYIGLWYKYLRQNQLLVYAAQQYDGFEDIFEGDFPFSQAKVIEQCVRHGIESLLPMTAGLRKLLSVKKGES
jgi:hypothetical protein